jgi:hypothetical protein
MSDREREAVCYGGNGYGECGSQGAVTTKRAVDVTCRTCRSWLPIFAPDWRDAYRAAREKKEAKP